MSESIERLVHESVAIDLRERLANSEALVESLHKRLSEQQGQIGQIEQLKKERDEIKSRNAKLESALGQHVAILACEGFIDGDYRIAGNVMASNLVEKAEQSEGVDASIDRVSCHEVDQVTHFDVDVFDLIKTSLANYRYEWSTRLDRARGEADSKISELSKKLALAEAAIQKWKGEFALAGVSEAKVNKLALKVLRQSLGYFIQDLTEVVDLDGFDDSIDAMLNVVGFDFIRADSQSVSFMVDEEWSEIQLDVFEWLKRSIESVVKDQSEEIKELRAERDLLRVESEDMKKQFGAMKRLHDRDEKIWEILDCQGTIEVDDLEALRDRLRKLVAIEESQRGVELNLSSAIAVLSQNKLKIESLDSLAMAQVVKDSASASFAELEKLKRALSTSRKAIDGLRKDLKRVRSLSGKRLAELRQLKGDNEELERVALKFQDQSEELEILRQCNADLNCRCADLMRRQREADLEHAKEIERLANMYSELAGVSTAKSALLLSYKQEIDSIRNNELSYDESD